MYNTNTNDTTMKHFEKTYETTSADGQRITRRMYDCTERNNKGERLEVEVHFCEEYGKNSLPHLWYKSGLTPTEINRYICIQTCVHSKPDEHGFSSCYGAYNPTEKAQGNRFVIDFDWHLPTSDENEEKLLAEVYRRFMDAK